MAQHRVATWLLAGSMAVACAGGSFMGCAPNLTGGAPICDEDDDNPCTVAQCPEGSTTYHVPVADKSECALGANAGVCVAGNCKLHCESNPSSCKCTSNAECPVSTACVTWACVNEQCARAIAADATLVDTVEEHDCKKTVCISGAPQVVNDENDWPTDILGDCHKPTCVNMMPTTTALDTDEPSDEDCTDWSCFNGEKISTTAAVGTTCAMGACNSIGQCADCLSAADWMICANGPACAAKLCNGEACNDGKNCISGACADGVCCNEACAGECKSCKVSGAVGTCTNIPYYETDPSYTDPVTMTPGLKCDTNFRCNGNGDCLRIVGKACSTGADCISGQCQGPLDVCLGAKGEPCSNNAVCVSGVCKVGFCD